MTRLDRALTYLRGNKRHRWAKGTLDDGHGHSCSLGAISRAWDDESMFREIPDQEALANVIRAQFPDRIRATFLRPVHDVADRDVIVSFNDHPLTKFKDIELVFEKAYLSEVTK